MGRYGRRRPLRHARGRDARLPGPRTYDSSGIPLHEDNQTIIKERIYSDKANPNILHDEITTIDNALTRPWTVLKTLIRSRNPMWYENNCQEGNNHVLIGKDNYVMSADGRLMPTRKNQAPPDLKLFRDSEEVAHMRKRVFNWQGQGFVYLGA